jgi:delta1-piperideine-2-carboxylate reductase
MLVETAKETGIAALALTNVHHFAALWVETEAVVEEGLAAMAFTSYMPSVAPAGASEPFFGTNPMAFGWPRPGQTPMVFDQASAAMARGEIMIAARDGHSVPEGGGLDADGNATTDPNAILKGGTQLPFGGYKGSSIAMMVELLASGLLGQPFSYEAAIEDNKDGGPPRGGELMIALDPARFGDADNWQAHCEKFFTELSGLEGTRLPGSRRHRNRAENQRGGVSVLASLVKKIEELTAK